MPRRFFFRLPLRLVQLLGFVLLLTGALVFALSKTQVGRDALRDRIVRAFDDRFEGSLEIGTLRGNLVNTLYASDVVLRDDAGEPLIVVDSVVLYPSWSGLFDQNIRVREVEFYRPTFHFVRDDQGWNLGRAFRPRGPRSSERAPWSFVGADVRIVDGTVRTSNPGERHALIEDRHVFDYTNATFSRVQARATIDWDRSDRLLDIQHVEAYVEDVGRAIEDLRGQLILRDDRLALNAFRLETGESYLDLSGSVDGFRPFEPQAREELLAAAIDLEIRPSRIRSGDVTPFHPTFPLSDVVGLNARASGPLSNLDIQRLVVERGDTRLRLSGRFNGTPDSISVALRLDSTRVRFADLDAVYPPLDLASRTGLATASLRFRLTGRIAALGVSGTRRRSVSGTIGVTSRAGGIRGGLSLVAARDSLLKIQADVQTRDLNLAGVLHDAPVSSRLNGRFVVDGAFGKGTTEGALLARIGRASIAERPFDSVLVQARLEDGALDLDLDARAPAGRVYGSAALGLAGETREYRAALQLRELDLAPLTLDRMPTTRLNGEVSLMASGRTLAELGGTLNLALRDSDLGLPPDAITGYDTDVRVALFQAAGERSRITVEGGLLDATLGGRFDLAAAADAFGLWGAALRETIATEFGKPREGQPRPVDPAYVAAFPDLQSSLRTRLAERGFTDPLSASLTLTINDAAPIKALLPAAPSFPGAFSLEGSARLGADDLALSIDARTDTLRLGGVDLSGISVGFEAASPLEPTLESSLEGRLTLEAETLERDEPIVRGVTLQVDYAGRRATMLVNSDQIAADGALLVDANYYLLSDRNRLTVNRLLFRTRGYTWAHGRKASIDFYDDALVVRNGVLEYRPPDEEAATGPVQRVTVEGTYSSLPGDTLYLGVEALDLQRISDLARLRQSFGGTLELEVALTRPDARPELFGHLQVEDLSLNGHDIGRLQVESELARPRTEGVRIAGTLRQDEPHAPRIERSDLAFEGVVEFPRTDPATGIREDGTLDIDVDVAEADLFFFDYIFESFLSGADGVGRGEGHVGGTFRRPIFDAEFEIEDGRFDVYEYGLTYGLSGPVRVDSAGIHLSDIRLTDGSGGSASFDGDISFNDYRYFSFDVRGGLDELLIIDVADSRDLPFYGTIRATGSLTLTGPIYNAVLRSPDAVTRPDSEIFIPITEVTLEHDEGFMVFADSTGAFPDLQTFTRRRNLISNRPQGERDFLDGLEMNLNFDAPPGSRVHLVFDPLLGDVINAVGTGRIQLLKREGEYFTFGTFNVNSGDYLFTASDVFARRFELAPGGTIVWDGDPIDGLLNVPATYRTRASLAGLPGQEATSQASLPFVIHMDITGRVTEPLVDLRLELDRDERFTQGSTEGIEALLNRPDLAAEYATSVLLTNTFLLTTSQGLEIADAADELLFNSLSQLVASQLNRFVSEVVENLDVNVGLQQRQGLEEIDLTYGFALRLLDSRLVIRGEGVYRADENRRNEEGFNGGLAIEVRLNPNVILEIFYRREGDPLEYATSLGSAYGAGLVYQTEFANWASFVRRLRGGPDDALPDALPVLPDTTLAPPDSTFEISLDD